MNKTTGIILAVVLIILAAAGGFYAGMQYRTMNRLQRFGGAYGMMGRGLTGQNNGVVRGQISSLSNNNMTVQLSDGSSKIVILSANTQFVQSVKAAQTDVKAGQTVMVFGTTNSDGSVTAQNVQINPQMGRSRPSQ